MAITFEAISSVTIGASATNSVSFTNIPNTYTDLQLFYSAKTSQGTGYSQNMRLTFNGSTSQYAEVILYKAGEAVNATSKALGTDAYLNWPALAQENVGTSIFGTGYFYIPNYTSTNTKSILNNYISEDDNATAPWITQSIGRWDAATDAAITSFALTLGAGNYAQYSTFNLYGIKNTV